MLHIKDNKSTCKQIHKTLQAGEYLFSYNLEMK